MDDRLFDRLARQIASPSRRGILAAAASAISTALFGVGAVDEASAKKQQKRRHAHAAGHDHGRVHADRKKHHKKKKCKGGLVRCGKRCVDPGRDAVHCGGCGNDCGPEGACQDGQCVLACGGTICHFDHASARCEDDTCVLGSCATGWVDCDGNPENGCEINILTDVEHCGHCATSCIVPNGTSTCTDGTCGVICHDGFADCVGYGLCETNIRTNPDHCGACKHACSFPNAGAVCQDGTCVMAGCYSNRPAEWFPLWENCDGDPSNGCETDILSDRDHCSGCGQACPDGQVCWLGVCELPCGEGGPCRVFVTAANYFRGNLGGLAGADRACQDWAKKSGLPGTYMAWLSDDTDSPSTRFLLKSNGPYRTVDGVTIADDWADLTDGTLDATIFVTETGYFPGGFLRVWTHTRPDGTAAAGNAHCQNWTVTSGAEYGDAGFCGSSSAEWTAHSVTDCVAQKRLYCFQQSG